MAAHHVADRVAAGLTGGEPDGSEVPERPRDLLATIEAILRTQDHHGNRDNKLRARMKWLVDTMGVEELRERILKERKMLVASAHGEMSSTSNGQAPARWQPITLRTVSPQASRVVRPASASSVECPT